MNVRWDWLLIAVWLGCALACLAIWSAVAWGIWTVFA